MIAIVILHIIVAIALIAIVLMQSGKTAGLSGSIAGGAETFFGKNKGRTIDAVLSKITKSDKTALETGNDMLYSIDAVTSFF